MGTTLARGIDRFVSTGASLWPPSRSAPDPPRKSRPRWPIIGAVSPSGPVPAPSARADALSARPRVTVVMAAYQAEQFLAEAIESTLDQDYPAELVEVLVVDDGSTDATGAIAAHYAAETGRVRVLRQDNAGNVAATTAAFACAEGDVVALLRRRRRLAAEPDRPCRRSARRAPGGRARLRRPDRDRRGRRGAPALVARGRRDAGGTLRRRPADGQQRHRLDDRHARRDAARARPDPGRRAVGGLVARRPLRRGLRARLPARAAHAVPLPRREHVARRPGRAPPRRAVQGGDLSAPPAAHDPARLRDAGRADRRLGRPRAQRRRGD